MIERDDTVKRVSDFLVLRMSQLDRYHDHKETMAHGAVLVSLALFGAVLSTAPWPPQWVPTFCIRSQAVAFVGVVVLWFFIHIYMRWQLRNRRAAAIYVVALLKILRTWATTPPSADQLKPWDQSPQRPARIHIVLDYLIPWRWASAPDDEELRGYPIALVEELQRLRTHAITGESIVTYGSLLLGLLLAVKALS